MRARAGICTILAAGRLLVTALLTTFALLLGPPLVYLVIIAASRYWDRCRVGINANANGLWLVFGKAPLLLVEQYAACGLAWALTIGSAAVTWRHHRPRPAGLVALALTVGCWRCWLPRWHRPGW